MKEIKLNFPVANCLSPRNITEGRLYFKSSITSNVRIISKSLNPSSSQKEANATVGIDCNDVMPILPGVEKPQSVTTELNLLYSEKYGPTSTPAAICTYACFFNSDFRLIEGDY